MSKSNFHVNITPFVALGLLKELLDADLVHYEYNEIDQDRSIGTLIFEKYYFRANNRAALIVIIDNLKGLTNVRSISTGSSEGMIFNFDWGAADDFVNSVEKILSKHITS